MFAMYHDDASVVISEVFLPDTSFEDGKVDPNRTVSSFLPLPGMSFELSDIR